MAYSTRIIRDSVSPAGARLTTLEVTLPRIVLSEFNTHRMFSRNSASSRAIPIRKQLQRVTLDPFVPLHWGANQSGMQATQELTGDAREAAENEWLKARNSAVASVLRLSNLGLHKQIANRLLEPFMWQTIIVTATEWDNFFALRANPDAQPEIRYAAELMRDAMKASTPQLTSYGEWHLPLIQEDELEWAQENTEDAIKVSVGRCARVSYLTHDGTRDRAKDIELYERLVASGHMSPTEHVATPHVPASKCKDNVYDVGKSEDFVWSGNFRGWKQYRKLLLHEDNFAEIQ